MKSIFPLISIIACLQSCVLFEYDNYEGPDATISGVIVDQEGLPLQLEHGGGARIKLLDYGYCDNPQEIFLNVKDDGTFVNTKMFSSTYDIVAEGPFVPLIQMDGESNIIVDKSLKNVTEKDFDNIVFQVEPYLKLSWIGEPVINSNGTISVTVKIVRGTDNVAFHKSLKDITLFVNTVKYVGTGNYDKFCSTVIPSAEANNMLGQDITLTTTYDEAHQLEKGRPYYVRVGARIDNSENWGGMNYNYTTVKKVFLPK